MIREAITFWILLRIHKAGLCKPFHYKKGIDNGNIFRPKGWCPVLYKAHHILDGGIKV